MKNSLFTATIFCFAICFTTAQADLVDSLDTTANFGSSFGGTTATANGDSTVTITRGAGNAGGDAGIDWRPGGTGFFSLNLDSCVTITPVDDPDNLGTYTVNILYFNASGGFEAEQPWFSAGLMDTDERKIDVATLNSDPDATQFFVRIRVTGSEGDSKTFDNLSAVGAVPEPGSTALVVSMIGLAALRRRK